jgi:beta-phosphoglucomutase-like phosphatase (HAD superfamily)
MHMLTYSEMQGAIFDVDDTLLSNYPDGSKFGLHERSRLAAAREVGKRHGSKGLQEFTEQQSTDAFLNAKVHTVFAAVWEMLVMAGEVAPGEVELAHPLLVEITMLKEELHKDILRTEGQAVPGAVQFVETMASGHLAGKLAIASTACRGDIDAFFDMSGLDRTFPDEQIISRERFKLAKPNPEPFNIAFATLELPESARPYVAAFEDDPRGIMSAKAAGLFTCAITTRFSRDELAALEVAPDLIADSYEEFAEAFGIPLAQSIN